MTDPHTDYNKICQAVARSLTTVQERIAVAAEHAGRRSSEVTLIAVSKTFPAAAVHAAILAGQRDFGENRVEEAIGKIGEIAMTDAVRWHLIGHVQSRKVKEAIGLFDLIHSIDSAKLAAAFSQRMASPIATRHPEQFLLECNVSGEESKSGFALAGWEHNEVVRAAFLRDVEQIAQLPHVRLRGLMTIAPIVEHPNQARPVFASLYALRELLRQRFPDIAWDHLSMGMSDDFEAAIVEGATLVRLGRAIFGERHYG